MVNIAIRKTMKDDKNIIDYRDEASFHYVHAVAETSDEVPIELHNYYELYFFLSGDIRFFIEGQSFRLNRHDILTINTNELHRAHVESNQPYERIVIHFGLKHLEGFSPGDYRVLNFITKRKVGYNNRIDAGTINTDAVYAHIDAIEEAITRDHLHAHLLVKSHFMQLLIVLNSLYCENVKDRLNEYYLDTRVARIMAYLNEHLDEAVSLDLLEKEFAVNKYYMCHLFKQKTGFSVFEYLRNKRIMKAKQLLLDGRTVLETCYDVGFNDYSSFSKAFKATVGIPPKQFAKMG